METMYLWRKKTAETGRRVGIDFYDIRGEKIEQASSTVFKEDVDFVRACRFSKQNGKNVLLTGSVDSNLLMWEENGESAGNNSTWEISSIKEKHVTNFSLIDLPMTIVTRGGNQVNEFIDITTKFLKFNAKRKRSILGYYQVFVER